MEPFSTSVILSCKISQIGLLATNTKITSVNSSKVSRENLFGACLSQILLFARLRNVKTLRNKEYSHTKNPFTHFIKM